MGEDMGWLSLVIGAIAMCWFLIHNTKKMLIIFSALSAVALGAWLWTEHLSQTRQQKLEAAVLRVVFDNRDCPADYPIHITIENSWTTNLLSVNFSLRATRPGHSDIIFDQSNPQYREDSIVAPGGKIGTCRMVPEKTATYADKIPETATWEAYDISPKFSED